MNSAYGTKAPDSRSTQRTRAITIMMVVAVIAVLVMTSPVQAVQLNLSTDTDSAEQGELVGLDLGVNIETDERVPFTNITLVMDGPTPQECTFALDGTPLDGCEGFIIFRTNEYADFGQGDNFGYGFDGSSSYGTDFGYGYGYGYGYGAFASSDELFYRVIWNTTDAAPGDYNVSFYTAADLNDIERTFNLENPQTITLVSGVVPPINGTQQADLVVTNVDGRTVDFLCQDNFNATTYDWYFGDGGFILDTTESTQTHVYDADGTYTVSCTATADDDTTRIDVGMVTVSGEGTIIPPPTGNTSAYLYVKEYYPQGADYVFVCDSQGYDSNSYDWDFGDGHSLTDVPNQEVFHTYRSNGEKTVFCAATGEGITESDTLPISVNGANPIVDVVIEDGYPQGAAYSFRCEVDGFVPETYDWNFGDGQKLFDVTDASVFHEYSTNGPYDVSCTAWDQQTSTVGIGYTHIDVTAAVTPPPVAEGDINLVRERIDDSHYAFTCETPNWTPDTYDWEIYNGAELLEEFDIDNRSILFTFEQDGKFVVSCTATDQYQTLIDWMWLTVDVESDHTLVQETPENERDAPATEITVDANSATLKVLPGASNDILLRILTDLEKRIDMSELLMVDAFGASAELPITVEFLASSSNGDIDVRLPAGITVTGDALWDGTMMLPRIVNTSATLPPGAVMGTAVVIGADGLDLTFDKGVRIRLDDRADETVAYVDDGALVVIDETCSADTQAVGDALVAGGDCRIVVGDDLVVWTKHFTEFVTYIEGDTSEGSSSVSTRSSRGGGGGGGYFTTKEAVWGIDSGDSAEEPAEELFDEASERRFDLDLTGGLEDSSDDERDADTASPITGLSTSSGGGLAGGWFALALIVGIAVLALIGVAVRRR